MQCGEWSRMLASTGFCRTWRPPGREQRLQHLGAFHGKLETKSVRKMKGKHGMFTLHVGNVLKRGVLETRMPTLLQKKCISRHGALAF